MPDRKPPQPDTDPRSVEDVLTDEDREQLDEAREPDAPAPNDPERPPRPA
jgi:hypothetical protein